MIQQDGWKYSPIFNVITFAASANCIRYAGAEVWFADINPDTYLLSIESVRSLLESKPRAMCPFQNQHFRSWLCKPFGDMPSLGFVSQLVDSKQPEVTRRQVMGDPK